MNQRRYATIELGKEDMHFSAAHFTVFGPGRRENLHGHDFFVQAAVRGPIDAGGLCFDYGELKSRLRALCGTLDETLLLAAQSPHLDIRQADEDVTVLFASERLAFARRDVTLLPIRNITVEELAHWFVQALSSDAGFSSLPIESMTLRVSSGPGQWAAATWPAGEQAGERTEQRTGKAQP